MKARRWRVGNIFVHINGDNPHTKIQTALNRLSFQPGANCRYPRDSLQRAAATGQRPVHDRSGPRRHAEDHLSHSRSRTTKSWPRRRRLRLPRPKPRREPGREQRAGSWASNCSRSPLLAPCFRRSAADRAADCQFAASATDAHADLQGARAGRIRSGRRRDRRPSLYRELVRSGGSAAANAGSCRRTRRAAAL